ncbi:maleylacetate reductase [Aquabacterium sp.]|uniref:maleylacetate reductase n=1 Tax=Aquabacterium sp. TaxID=1872578 RepID=UPI002C18074F|nr:maleylacetate reductase [Aquabacterium sp.]HSW05905.1 maleylacetate reductase [Aquabacterium sp.]
MSLPAHFIYEGRPGRVVFGAGSRRHVERELIALGAKRALVLCTPEQQAVADEVAGLLGDRAAGVFPGAVMHVPIEVAREASARALALGADCCVAVGGGSTVGLGKAIALDAGLPIVAIPTTYAGSEMTPIYGITESGLKKTGRDARVLPRAVLYDPELTSTLPPAIRLTSGVNAIAHAAEGLYAHDGNPITALMAEEGMRAIAGALDLFGTGDGGAQAEAHALALYGAWLCGTVLGSVAMGLHHKLCHTLGGSFDLPHADTHTVMLPHTLAYNATHAGDAMARTARALGQPDAPLAVYELISRHAGPLSLKQLGMPEAGLDRVAELAVSNPYPNPRPLERDALRAMLQRAWEGQPPSR